MIKKAIQTSINVLFKILITLYLTYFILSFFGIRFYVVPTGSMEPVIHAGSLVVINEQVEYTELTEGDIIVYNQSSERRIIHRVIEISEDGIRTKGDANPVADSSIITQENYVGRYVCAIPNLGNILEKLCETPYKIAYVAIMIGLCVLDLTLDKIRKKKGKEKET